MVPGQFIYFADFFAAFFAGAFFAAVFLAAAFVDFFFATGAPGATGPAAADDFFSATVTMMCAILR
jgi:hypothetical protein